jgi:hypothetical protein
MYLLDYFPYVIDEELVLTEGVPEHDLIFADRMR